MSALSEVGPSRNNPSVQFGEFICLMAILFTCLYQHYIYVCIYRIAGYFVSENFHEKLEEEIRGAILYFCSRKDGAL